MSYTIIKEKYIPNKKEIETIFKKYNLNLSFPNKAKKGGTVTDYNLLYNYVSYDKSELKRFREIIEKYI
jgi:hypothetical protein